MSDGPISNLPSNDRASRDRTTEGIVRRLIGGGIALAARFTTSLRVGSGSATLAGLDGTDGVVMADGPNAAFIGRDRANSAQYFIWYENGTVRLNTQQGGDVWLIDPATGYRAHTTPVVPVLGGGWVAFGGGYPAPTYWRDADGVVHLEGVLAGGTLGTVAFTLPSGFRPVAQRDFAAECNGVHGTLIVTAAGAVTPSAGSTAFFSFDGATFRTT